MRRKEALELRHGLYEIFWKSGGSSLASIGSTHKGQRWFAPANWTSANERHPVVASTNWRIVARVDPIMTN